MFRRLGIYCREMYPVIPRLALGFIIFGEIYFIVLLNNGITGFQLGWQEAIGAYTVFCFLFILRIADDFKDFELDRRLFSERPLPSGRVNKRDLILLLIFLAASSTALNFLFMNYFGFFLFLYLYGTLMSLWFFQKHKIQKSLPLALLTHNPVQMIMNVYIISFTCMKYGLPGFTLTTVLAAWTLYFPALIWEIARKIRAPKDETEYVTYSSLFGYKKSTWFILILTWVDIATNVLLVLRLNRISIAALLLNTAWMTWQFLIFMRGPEAFRIVDKVERYTYIQESIMLLTIPAYLIFGPI